MGESVGGGADWRDDSEYICVDYTTLGRPTVVTVTETRVSHVGEKLTGEVRGHVGC